MIVGQIEGTKTTNWDHYGSPEIIRAICIVQDCQQPQAGHAPTFSTPGELLEAYNNPKVKAWCG